MKTSSLFATALGFILMGLSTLDLPGLVIFHFYMFWKALGIIGLLVGIVLLPMAPVLPLAFWFFGVIDGGILLLVWFLWGPGPSLLNVSANIRANIALEEGI